MSTHIQARAEGASQLAPKAHRTATRGELFQSKRTTTIGMCVGNDKCVGPPGDSPSGVSLRSKGAPATQGIRIWPRCGQMRALPTFSPVGWLLSVGEQIPQPPRTVKGYASAYGTLDSARRPRCREAKGSKPPIAPIGAVITGHLGLLLHTGWQGQMQPASLTLRGTP